MTAPREGALRVCLPKREAEASKLHREPASRRRPPSRATPGRVDGLPGRRTTTAVRRFQQDLGMTPTGRISEELLALLKVAAAAR